MRLDRYLYFLIYCLAWINIPLALAQNQVCEETDQTRIWISPLNPQPNEFLKVMVVSTEGPISDLVLIDNRGNRIPLQTNRYSKSGPPWSLIARIENLSEESFRIEANRKNKLIACHRFTLDQSNTPERSNVNWNLATEAFYSAWIEALFGAPLEENFSYTSLEPVLRNAERNFLHNYHGLNEDINLPLTPDCADLPYILRTYFAWKIGLPIAYRTCTRGSSKIPPHCGTPTIMTEFMGQIGSHTHFTKLSRQLINTIHSSSLRTQFEDESSDLYPIPLSRETLWPGTVFADPYGHILMLAEWIPQTVNRSGLLLAVDAQPDNSITRKRVWEGTLLFTNTKNSGPGFKAFRPLVPTNSGTWRTLLNDELTNHPEFIPFSLEQSQLSPENFYAKLAKLINPEGLNPKQAYENTLAALLEQIETRVTSINNGEAYLRKKPHNIIPMPNGAAIFQTTGPWEDYSTPSRDMRLIIAINVLTELPDKIVRYPELFLLDGKAPQAVRAEIEQHHAQRIQEQSIRYMRSDGSLWELTLAEFLARKPAYEMAYNPNDCAEIRWGAIPDTDEYSTCLRHAPAAQHEKMEQYRIWFREARRPLS